MKNSQQKSNLWNVPNILTMLRLLLIPVYVAVFIYKSKTWALIIFLIASLTDLLDGRIARKFNLVTTFGKIADPVADKLMVTTVLLSQVLDNVLPKTAVVMVIAKEAILLFGGAVLLKKGFVIPSEMAGKVAQVMFIASLFLSFFHDFFEKTGFPLDIIFLWISVALSYVALVYYAVHAYKLIKDRKLDSGSSLQSK